MYASSLFNYCLSVSWVPSIVLRVSISPRSRVTLFSNSLKGFLSRQVEQPCKVWLGLRLLLCWLRWWIFCHVNALTSVLCIYVITRHRLKIQIP